MTDAPTAPAPVDGWPSAERLALFLDVDGTLVEIADRPEGVRVEPRLPPILARLRARTGNALALVSGRPIAQLDQLFASDTLPAGGIHGLQRRSADGTLHPVPDTAALEAVRGAFRDVARADDRLVLEDKRLAVAVHYRAAPELRDRILPMVEALVAKADGALDLLSGKMVFEVRPAGSGKDRAVAAFLDEAPFHGRIPVFIGDDTTDEDGFVEVNRRGGLSVHVGFERPRTEARYRVADVATVHDLLAALADPETPPAGAWALVHPA